MSFHALTAIGASLCALLWEDICRAASFKAENSFVSTSHWLLTWTALSSWRGCSLVSQVAVKIAAVVAASPRGGSYAGSVASMAAWAAWLSTLACPRPAAGVPQVSVRPAVSGWAGRALAGRSCPGIVTHIRGGSVIFGALTGELACSGVLAH